MKKSTKKLTVAAVLCAATFVVMLVGSIFDVMDLSAAALASFAVIFAVIELGGAYPVLVWLVTSSAAMLLLPNKLPAIYFALFFCDLGQFIHNFGHLDIGFVSCRNKRFVRCFVSGASVVHI